VLTVHDLSPLERPEWFQPAFAALYRALLPLLIRRARYLIVPSRYTRRQLLRWFPDLAGKVSVVPGGVDRSHFYPRGREEIEAVRREFCLPETYVLTVGSLQPRKNLRRLLAGWELAAPAFPGAALALAGESGVQFRREALGTPPARVHLLDYVPDGLLPALYSGAAAFILPALEEGFGLPLLEALACGVPVAAAGCGALPELTEEVGLLFDPLSPEAIAASLETMLGTDKRGELLRRGQERAALYPWERTAAGVRELLERVARN
jgi:glycosyltransferase involved in cell wall biosynthesis